LDSHVQQTDGVGAVTAHFVRRSKCLSALLCEYNSAETKSNSTKYSDQMNIEITLTRLETTQLVRHIGEEEATDMFKNVLTQDAAYHSLLHTQRRESFLNLPDVRKVMETRRNV
jgi:hypothetical protein